jgi:hypothetical protein
VYEEQQEQYYSKGGFCSNGSAVPNTVIYGTPGIDYTVISYVCNSESNSYCDYFSACPDSTDYCSRSVILAQDGALPYSINYCVEEVYCSGWIDQNYTYTNASTNETETVNFGGIILCPDTQSTDNVCNTNSQCSHIGSTYCCGLGITADSEDSYSGIYGKKTCIDSSLSGTSQNVSWGTAVVTCANPINPNTTEPTLCSSNSTCGIIECCANVTDGSNVTSVCVNTDQTGKNQTAVFNFTTYTIGKCL